MLEILLAAIGGWLAQVIKDYVAERRRDATSKDLGAAEGSVVLNKATGDIADEQARNNVVDRGRAGDVARRLRTEAAATGRGAVDD